MTRWPRKSRTRRARRRARRRNRRTRAWAAHRAARARRARSPRTGFRENPLRGPGLGVGDRVARGGLCDGAAAVAERGGGVREARNVLQRVDVDVDRDRESAGRKGDRGWPALRASREKRMQRIDAERDGAEACRGRAGLGQRREIADAAVVRAAQGIQLRRDAEAPLAVEDEVGQSSRRAARS